MAASPLTQLVDQLRQHPLLSPHQIDELTRSWTKRFTEPKPLVLALVERGWLTAYQGKLLLLGRGGELVLGAYTILDRLGEGGNGQVFKARHRAMNRLVALKLLRPDAVSDAEAAARFRREIEVASHISHPNIVHALDAGPAGSGLVLAMEYVEGVDLHQLVKASGPLPVAQACDYIRQAALGLQHAHERGLVHRDIKPSNLLLRRSSTAGSSDFQAGPWGQVKILDLGLARLLQPPAASPTRNLTVLAGNTTMQGTPDYMAPEQAVDFHSADIRSDIYSLGCTFYFLLAGQAPFAGAPLAEKLIKHQTVEPRPIQELRGDVSAAVGQVLSRMLAKRSGDRQQTPAAVAAELAELKELDTQASLTVRITRRLPRPTQFLPRMGLGRSLRLIGLAAAVAGLFWLGSRFFSGSPAEPEPVKIDPATALRDPGFETPLVGAGVHGAFRHQPKESAWTFRGSAGISGNASGYTAGNPKAPEGGQVAYLQGTGAISQSINLSAGAYQLQFQAAQRQNTQHARQSFRVLLDGEAIGSFEPSTITYAGHATGPFHATSGPHTLSIEALNPLGGDNTVFLDQLQIVPAGQAQPVPGWTILDPADVRSLGGAVLTRQPDASWLASGPNPPSDQYQITFRTPLTGITGVRLEVLPHPSLPSQGPGRSANGNIVLSHFQAAAAPRGQEAAGRPIVIGRALADFEQDNFPITASLTGDLKRGWALLPQPGKPHAAIYEFQQPVSHAEGTMLTVLLRHAAEWPDHNIGRFRLAATTQKPPLNLSKP